jgi:hypothetical protein
MQYGRDAREPLIRRIRRDAVGHRRFGHWAITCRLNLRHANTLDGNTSALNPSLPPRRSFSATNIDNPLISFM